MRTWPDWGAGVGTEARVSGKLIPGRMMAWWVAMSKVLECEERAICIWLRGVHLVQVVFNKLLRRGYRILTGSVGERCLTSRSMNIMTRVWSRVVISSLLLDRYACS